MGDAPSSAAEWSAERIDLCKRLWADGLSAGQIANELGGITRNAVIGKVHRLGLKGRGGSPSVSRVPKAPKEPRVKIVRPRRPAAASDGVTDIASVDDAAIPVEQRRTITTIEHGCCHWPVGEPSSPEFFFCGAPVAQRLNDKGEKIDMPYCGTHYRRAYTAARPPRSLAETEMRRRAIARGQSAAQVWQS